MSTPKYPSYKDVPIPWISSIPEHWDWKPVLGAACERDEDNKGMKEDNLLSLSYGNIVNKDINTSDGLLPESFETYQIVRPGDIVLRLTDLQNDKRSLRSALVTQTGIITSAYLALKPESIDPKYLGYLLRAYDVSKVFYSMGGGLRQSMKYGDIKRMPLVIPTKAEQSEIASFLDHETAKIDALIAEQQRLIELLQEKRQAVISHAVTKGLNPNAPMRDSGVEWLGEVPEHWKIMGLAKTTLLLQTGPFGSQLGTADYKGEGVAVINPSNISEGSIDTSYGPFIAMNKALELERHKLYKGDLVIARRGEMGRCAVVKDGKEEKLCGTGSILVRPLDWMCTDFMAHIIRSEYSRASLSLNSVGSTMENLSAAIVGKLRIPVPPREEQVQIVDWIRSIASSYQCLANNSVRAIELLQERRSALISAAVTGQIDVRELAETETDKR